MTPYETLLYFIRERESIRLKKEAGLPPPWTDDPILGFNRFCNVHREDDKETRWLHQNWLHPHADDPDVWFAMAVARHVNKSSTLAAMGYPVPWKPKKFIDVIQARMLRKEKAYNAAYMIRASRGDEWADKSEYLAKAVLGAIWKNRNKLRPKAGERLADFNERLVAQFGVAGFMSGQIIADAKHVGVLKEALDWWSFAVSGPGSKRGLNRVLERPVNSKWKEEEWHRELMVLMTRVCSDLLMLRGIDAQNLQNCLCETDKYLRTVAGEGRPKQRYVPSRGGLLCSS